MRKALRALSLTMSVVTIVGLLGACGTKKQADAGTTPSTSAAPTTAEPYTLSLLWGNDPTKPLTYEKDILAKEMEAKLNIKLKLEYCDNQQYGQKLSLAIASGSTPDVVGFTGQASVTLDDYKRYASQNIFADLTSLINEKDTPNLNKELSQDLRDKAKVKGKLYGVPYNSGPGAGFRFNVMYRKDYLDAMGAKPAKTLDEYYSLLKKVKETKPDVIPLGAFGSLGEQRFAANSFDMVFGAYSVQPGYFYVENDSVKSYDINPKMKDALAYLKKMYAEGLIDKEWATMKEQNLKEKYVAGKIFSDLSWWTNPYIYDKEIEIFELKKAGKLPADGTITENLENTPFKYISFAQVPTGADGKNVAGFGSEFNAIRAISAKTKDVKRVLQLFDLGCTLDVNMYANWGKEGRDYNIKDGKLDASVQGTADAKTGIWPDGYMRSLTYLSFAPNIKGIPRYMESLTLRRADPLKSSLGTPGQISDASAFLNSDSKNAKFKNLCTLRDSTWSQIILGGDISLFDDFVTKWKAQGGDDILKELTADYKDKMGK